MFRITRNQLETFEQHRRLEKILIHNEDTHTLLCLLDFAHLESEDHLVSGLWSQAPEEGVALVSPDQAVMLVMLYGRLCNSLRVICKWEFREFEHYGHLDITDGSRGIFVWNKQLHSSKLTIFQLLNFALEMKVALKAMFQD